MRLVKSISLKSYYYLLQKTTANTKKFAPALHINKQNFEKVNKNKTTVSGKQEKLSVIVGVEHEITMILCYTSTTLILKNLSYQAPPPSIAPLPTTKS